MLPLPIKPMFIARFAARYHTSAVSEVISRAGHLQPDDVLDISPVDRGGFLRRARVVGNGVQLDDRPTAIRDLGQRREHTLDVDAAAPQLDEPIIAARRRGPGLHILYLQEPQAIRVLPD